MLAAFDLQSLKFKIKIDECADNLSALKKQPL